MSLPEPELRDILTKAYGTESAHHAEMLKQIDDDPTAAERLVQAIEPTVTRIRHSLQKAYERTKDAHAWMTKLREETDLAYKACANYKFYLNKSRGGMAVGSGLPLLDEESPTHRAWLTKALLEQGTGDRFGGGAAGVGSPEGTFMAVDEERRRQRDRGHEGTRHVA